MGLTCEMHLCTFSVGGNAMQCRPPLAENPKNGRPTSTIPEKILPQCSCNETLFVIRYTGLEFGLDQKRVYEKRLREGNGVVVGRITPHAQTSVFALVVVSLIEVKRGRLQGRFRVVKTCAHIVRTNE